MQELTSQNTSKINFSFEETLTKQVKHIPIKRGFDIFMSLMALIGLSPLFLVLAILIKLSSKGCIIYSQKRVGRGGALFNCYKFRTMRQDAEEQLIKMLNDNPQLHKEWIQHRKLKNDPRIHPLGKFLRKSSLDELPQLWNVLKGDISIVGPRPVVKAELIDYYKSKAAKILSVRPGLTGLWQISGRNNLNYEERIFLDEKYIEEQSLKLDLKIILKTIPIVLYGHGAY